MSETKDPLRVQPHLKKCFEGICKLEYTNSQEIVAMISAEQENVPFAKRIVPAAAKVLFFLFTYNVFFCLHIMYFTFFCLCIVYPFYLIMGVSC